MTFILVSQLGGGRRYTPRVRRWVPVIGVSAGYLLAAVLVGRLDPAAFRSPWFVVSAMISVLGLAFVARPVVPLRLPPRLATVRKWERAFYRRLGVETFGNLLRDTPLRLLNTYVYRQAGDDDFARLQAELEAAEAAHLASAALVVPFMARLAVRGEWWSLLGVSAAQALVNLYPVMHLRLARLRVWRLSRMGVHR
jgi:hypothetical protein